MNCPGHEFGGKQITKSHDFMSFKLNMGWILTQVLKYWICEQFHDTIKFISNIPLFNMKVTFVVINIVI